MNTNKRFKLNKLIILALSIGLIFTGLLTLKTNKNKAFANAPLYTELMPTTSLESKDISSPVDVYFGDEIILSLSDKRILFSKGENLYTRTVVGAPKQIKNLDSEYFLICIEGSIYKHKKSEFTTADLEGNEYKQCGSNEFDTNGVYLVSAFSNELKIYKWQEGALSLIKDGIGVANNKPVCINANNDIFYINTDNKLCVRNGNDFLTVKECPASILPEHMISDNEYVYYTSGNKIYKYNVSLEGEPIELTVTDNYADYELGNLFAPCSINFKGNNLLIGDGTLKAVQEFTIDQDNNTLTFTGYAIASGKTAYNRISKNATDIEKYGDDIAVLDGKKITLINNAENFEGKNPSLFTNYLLNDFKNGEYLPNLFALGKENIMLGYANETVKLIDIESGEFCVDSSSTEETKPELVISLDGAINDICYNNGYYYVATDDGASSAITKINGEDYSKETVKTFEGVNVKLIAVDMFGNIYYADNSVIKSVYDNNFSAQRAGATKLATDLAGKLYISDGADVKYLSASGVWETADLGPTNIKTFTMSFDDNRVFFLQTNSESVYQTSSLANTAINTLDIPAEYKLTGENAPTELKTAKFIAEDDNVYEITVKDGKYDFIDFKQREEEYIYICEVTLSASKKLVALAGQNGIVLANSASVETSSPTLKDEVPQTAYVTTGVHVYYYPIITPSGDFVLIDESSIRLDKSTLISPVHELTAFGREMYLAKVLVDGKTYTGYVPKAYTVATLAEDVVYSEYTYANVKACVVYAEKELKTQLESLAENTLIKLGSVTDNVAEIYFSKEGVWVKGYISADTIIQPQNNLVRNVVVVMVAITCIAVTSAYFILKKKS